MKRFLLGLPLLVLVGCGGDGGSSGPSTTPVTVFSAGAPTLDGAFSSDSVPDQINNQRIAETFPVTTAVQATKINWAGRSEFAEFADLRNLETFTLKVYRDANGLPGEEIYTATFPVADAQVSEIGPGDNGATVYNFSHTLTAPLNLTPGDYWVSVGTDNLDPDGDGFYWSTTATVGSGNFATSLPVGDPWQTSGFADLFFEVEGER